MIEREIPLEIKTGGSSIVWHDFLQRSKSEDIHA